MKGREQFSVIMAIDLLTPTLAFRGLSDEDDTDEITLDEPGDLDEEVGDEDDDDDKAGDEGSLM